MIYKLFYQAEQINKQPSINPFGDFIPRIGDTAEIRVTKYTAPYIGDTKWLAIVKVDAVFYKIDSDIEDAFHVREIHISVSDRHS